jgi:Kdo2-lipid IVA lauroyltransferase/acyltransferase
VNLLLTLLARLPLCVLYRLAWVLYFVVFRVLRYRRAQAEANLRACFAKMPAHELSEIARRCYLNLALVAAETVRGYAISEGELRERVRFVNPEVVQAEVASGRNLVLLAAHHCNWEWLALAGGAVLGVPIDVVYKPLHVGFLDRFMARTRSRFGGHPIEVRRFLPEVLQRRATGRVIALVADQSPREHEEKHWTRFLGRDTAFHVGAEKIARLGHVSVAFVGMKRLDRGRYEARFTLLARPPYSGPPGIVMERYARAVEVQVLESPADWLWTHRRWKYARPVYA